MQHALKQAFNQNVIVSQQLNFYLAILLSDYIFCTIPSTYKIMMTNISLFLPKAAPLSIYLSSKPFSLKPWTRSCVDKKNLSTISRCYRT